MSALRLPALSPTLLLRTRSLPLRLRTRRQHGIHQIRVLIKHLLGRAGNTLGIRLSDDGDGRREELLEGRGDEQARLVEPLSEGAGELEGAGDLPSLVAGGAVLGVGYGYL